MLQGLEPVQVLETSNLVGGEVKFLQPRQGVYPSIFSMRLFDRLSSVRFTAWSTAVIRVTPFFTYVSLLMPSTSNSCATIFIVSTVRSGAGTRCDEDDEDGMTDDCSA